MTPNTLALLTLLAVLIGGTIRLLKTDALNALLASFNVPPVPKRFLPWLALALGFLSATVQALLAGKTVVEALIQGVYGLMSGATAVAGDQTVGKLLEGTGKASADPSQPQPPAGTP